MEHTVAISTTRKMYELYALYVIVKQFITDLIEWVTL